MRSNWRMALLAAGITSVFASGVLAASGGLEAFVARLKGADAAARRQIMTGLTKAELKALHQEFRALPPDAKKAVQQVLRGKKTAARAPKRAPHAIGTVQYDTGVPHGFRDNTNAVAGNQFNVGFGNPHTISVVTFQQAGTFGFTPVRVYGAPVGTVAPVLAGTTFSGVGVGFPVQWDLPNIVAHNGSFLVGESQSGSSDTVNPTWVAVAVDVNNGGAGFHGMNINLGGSGFVAGATVFPGQPYNAIMRATGENLPVELMHFNVQ